MIRTIFNIGLAMVVASGSAMASSFEFAGLSRATTQKDAESKYPNSKVNGSTIYVSPKDTHDHIFQITLFEKKFSNRLRISFESPDGKYPPCESIERVLILKHGKPTETREFYEEVIKNRYLLWKLELETVQLQCFMHAPKGGYFAEAINVYPSEPKVEQSNPAFKRDAEKRGAP